eukprot:403358075
MSGLQSDKYQQNPAQIQPQQQTSTTYLNLSGLQQQQQVNGTQPFQTPAKSLSQSQVDFSATNQSSSSIFKDNNAASNSNISPSRNTNFNSREPEEFSQKTVELDQDVQDILTSFQINVQESQEKILKSICRQAFLSRQQLEQRDQSILQLKDQMNQLEAQKQLNLSLKNQSKALTETLENSVKKRKLAKFHIVDLKQQLTGLRQEFNQILKNGHNQIAQDFQQFQQQLKKVQNQKLSYKDQEFLLYKEEYLTLKSREQLLMQEIDKQKISQEQLYMQIQKLNKEQSSLNVDKISSSSLNLKQLANSQSHSYGEAYLLANLRAQLQRAKQIEEEALKEKSQISNHLQLKQLEVGDLLQQLSKLEAEHKLLKTTIQTVKNPIQAALAMVFQYFILIGLGLIALGIISKSIKS